MVLFNETPPTRRLVMSGYLYAQLWILSRGHSAETQKLLHSGSFTVFNVPQRNQKFCRYIHNSGKYRKVWSGYETKRVSNSVIGRLFRHGKICEFSHKCKCVSYLQEGLSFLMIFSVLTKAFLVYVRPLLKYCSLSGHLSIWVIFYYLNQINLNLEPWKHVGLKTDLLTMFKIRSYCLY